MPPGILTLTTDFGMTGPYVGAVKGVILGLAPGVQIVDITHTVTPQNVLEGAFVLASIVDAFPAGTVHLAVIDPGVGTDRKLVAAQVSGQWFVLPDNGLISAVLRDRPLEAVHEISNPSVYRAKVSSTFHGRDILAPAAAHLLRGDDPGLLGPKLDKIERLATFDPRPDDAGGFIAEVVFRDWFGNLITNLPAELLLEAPASEWALEIAGQQIDGLSRTYGDHPPGKLIALAGSSGWIEIAVVDGDAGRFLGAGSGATVWARRRPVPSSPPRS